MPATSSNTPSTGANAILDVLNLSVPHRILFVSPHSILNRSFIRAVSGEHMSVDIDIAETFAAALDYLQQHTYTAILATMDQKTKDGITLLEASQTLSSHTSRILISTSSDVNETVQAFNRAQLYSIVLLPWEPSELRQIINGACDNFTIHHENRELSKLLGDHADTLGDIIVRLEKNVQARTASLLTGLIAALDLRDTETQGHSRRVALYSKRVAQELDTSKEECIDIERGALLHDIGKIGVSDTILLKPGKLTEEEWVYMRQHAEHGFRILENIPFLGDARHIVHQHHERFDGNGYPQKIAGKDIILGARIFAIIDTYDAMTSDRPYRKGLSHEIAIEEINKCSGQQFDPDIVLAWNRIPRSDLETLKERAETDILAGAIQ